MSSYVDFRRTIGIRLPNGRLLRRLKEECTCFLNCRSNACGETRLGRVTKEEPLSSEYSCGNGITGAWFYPIGYSSGVPEGPHDNSPTLQRWEQSSNRPSPEGTAEI